MSMPKVKLLSSKFGQISTISGMPREIKKYSKFKKKQLANYITKPTIYNFITHNFTPSISSNQYHQFRNLTNMGINQFKSN